jgi:hypothetical protein
MVKAPKIQLIEWTDTFAIEDEWYDLNTKHPARHILTCGYLVGEDDQYVHLATTFDRDSETYSVAIAIYKPCIQARTTIAPKGYH